MEKNKYVICIIVFNLDLEDQSDKNWLNTFNTQALIQYQKKIIYMKNIELGQ